MYSCQEVVLLVRQHIIINRHPWSHQFGDASLHQFLGKFRVFQLVADSHTLAGTNELRQVSVKRMERETGHLHMLGLTIGTLSERNAQNISSRNGIFRIGFIKVTTSEKHHCIGMFLLQLEVLFHHGGHYDIFCHGSFLSLSLNDYFCFQNKRTKITKHADIS